MPEHYRPRYVPNAPREYYQRLDPLSFYTEKKFIQRYRISKDAARLLIKFYVSTKQKKVMRGKHAITHRLLFLCALRYFATGADYLMIGDCHGVSKPTVCRAVKWVSDYFHHHLSTYVVWPDSKTEKNCIAMMHYKDTGIPGCFGLIDGTHIPIACPRGMGIDENQYFCYKGYYSINAMVVCDFEGMIRHVDASNPGTCNDIYCMNGSQIKELGERGDFGNFYLLGDSGYVLTDYILTPIRTEQNIREKRYNRWHKSTRSFIERKIGAVKQRLRCLDTSGGYLFHDPIRAARIIESCVCLHNCATTAKVKLLKDFPRKDGFRSTITRVVQPQNLGHVPLAEFVNMRKKFIDNCFNVPLKRPPKRGTRAAAGVGGAAAGVVRAPPPPPAPPVQSCASRGVGHGTGHEHEPPHKRGRTAKLRPRAPAPQPVVGRVTRGTGSVARGTGHAEERTTTRGRTATLRPRGPHTRPPVLGRGTRGTGSVGRGTGHADEPTTTRGRTATPRPRGPHTRPPVLGRGTRGTGSVGRGTGHADEPTTTRGRTSTLRARAPHPTPTAGVRRTAAPRTLGVRVARAARGARGGRIANNGRGSQSGLGYTVCSSRGKYH